MTKEQKDKLHASLQIATAHDSLQMEQEVCREEHGRMIEESIQKQLNTKPRKLGDVITNSLGMKFAWVPPGESWLGGGGITGKSKKWNQGTNKFTLKDGLWCGVYPVTQAEWQAVMGVNPSHFKGNPRYPVECVSWHDVQQFIERLSQRRPGEGFLYRLPSEEEWEYICRGGPISQDQSGYRVYFARSKSDLTPAPCNDLSSTQANFDGNLHAGYGANGPFLGHPSDVGSYLPNPLGIYDLHGNVWEWTSSVTGEARVVCGGCWSHGGRFCAATGRNSFKPGYRSSDRIGFRLLAVPTG
jgi:formylglycine-generating enzyme required for sulfatase activity